MGQLWRNGWRKTSGLVGKSKSAHPSFGKLRAQAKSSKFQTPSSKEAPISKLKYRPARRLPRHLFLELGVWSLVFRSPAAQRDVPAKPMIPPRPNSSSPTLHRSHYFNRTPRHGVQEGLTVAFGQDAVVEHADDATVGRRAKQASDALAELEDGFRQRKLLERVAAARFDGLDVGLDQRMVGHGKWQSREDDVAQRLARHIDAL